MYLPHLTSKQIQAAFEKCDLAVVPTGSVESHGPHLGTGTDYLVAEHIANRVAETADTILAPVLPYGYSSNHAIFPGTISLRPDVFRAVVEDVCTSLQNNGARRFLFVNGHSGNTALLQQICDRLRTMHCVGCIANWWSIAGELHEDFMGTGHGDYMEASAMLAVQPEAVHMDEAVPYKRKALTAQLIVLGWDRLKFKDITLHTWMSTREASDTGSTGKLDGASAQLGQRAISAIVQCLVELCAEMRKIDLDALT